MLYDGCYDLDVWYFYSVLLQWCVCFGWEQIYCCLLDNLIVGFWIGLNVGIVFYYKCCLNLDWLD